MYSYINCECASYMWIEIAITRPAIPEDFRRNCCDNLKLYIKPL